MANMYCILLNIRIVSKNIVAVEGIPSCSLSDDTKLYVVTVKHCNQPHCEYTSMKAHGVLYLTIISQHIDEIAPQR